MSPQKIDPQGTLKPSKTGSTHLPKRIRKELGNVKEIPFVADAHTVILFNPEKTPKEILESLKVLRDDILLRIITTKDKTKNENGVKNK